MEKGRIAYYAMFGLLGAVCFLANAFFSDDPESGLSLSLPPMPVLYLLLFLLGAGCFALSWYLSTVLIGKREAA